MQQAHCSLADEASVNLGLSGYFRSGDAGYQQQQQQQQRSVLDDEKKKKKKKGKKRRKEAAEEEDRGRLYDGDRVRDRESSRDHDHSGRRKRDRDPRQWQEEGRRSPPKAQRLQFSLASITGLQGADGSWQLTPELEQHLGMKPGTAMGVLRGAGLTALADSERATAPALFATAMALLALEVMGEREADASIARGRAWLEATERQTISAAYQLGLGSSWTVAARAVLQQRSTIWRSCVSEGATWNTPLAALPRAALSPSAGAGLVQMQSTYGIPADLHAGEIRYC